MGLGSVGSLGESVIGLGSGESLGGSVVGLGSGESLGKSARRRPGLGEVARRIDQRLHLLDGRIGRKGGAHEHEYLFTTGKFSYKLLPIAPF